jgi:drug/metabolite transporter (DMT)-like permease
VLQKRAWAAVLMSLIGLFGMAESGGNIRRGVYVIGVAVLIAAVALWLAATAMTRARRIGSTRPRGAVFATLLAIIGVGLGALVLALCAVFWPQLTQFSNCESGAGTLTAQQACYQQMQNSVGREIGIIGRSG